jgi:hypothetical protein
MKLNLITRIISILLVCAILLQPLAASVKAQQLLNHWRPPIDSSTRIEGTGSHAVFLPVITTPPGPPDFEIISPADGWTVSGMMYFAAQPRDMETVSSVTFTAGSTPLGTDDTPADGFRVFFDASAFPAGMLTLTATGSGPSGQTVKTITVNVVPDPPSSGTIGSQGGVLDSEIGSIITIPPDALPDGTTVTVDELSQEEVTQQNGIDWEAMGVTFLGAQAVQSTAAFSVPYRVASADFGNRVQPGQTVVNYQIVPDADGDGVDEIVVVNTASVAPNDDVISDPIPQPLLSATTMRTGMGQPTWRGLGEEIIGPPGTVIEISATGFNPASIMGNVAVYHSDVDGSEVAVPVFVSSDLAEGTEQIVMAMIPPMTSGPATLTLRNESTGYTAAPLVITVTEAAPLDQPPAEIIEAALVETLDSLNEINTLIAGEDWPDVEDRLNQGIEQTNLFRIAIQEISIDPTPEEEEMLHNMAIMLENANLSANLSQLATIPHGPCDHLNLMHILISIAGGLGLALIVAAALAPATLLAVVLALIVAAALWVLAAVLGIKLSIECRPIPIPPCPPSQTAAGSGGGQPGMGSVVVASGVGCGGLIGPSTANSRFGPGAGGIVIKVFSAGLTIPFSGVTDPGGYFFIPIIPAGEPFTAVAYDMVNGTTRIVEGVGPATGDFTFLFFDFYTEQPGSDTVYWDGGGDGTSWHDPFNWNPDLIPGPSQDVIIDVPGDVTVVHSNFGTDAILSLQSEEAVVLSGGTLDIAAASNLSDTFTLNGGVLAGSGDVTLSGPFTWAYGTLAGTGATIANGGITFNGSNTNARNLDGRTLANGGTAVLQEGFLTAYNGATLTNQPSATFDFQGDHFLYVSTGGATFDNLGTVTKSAGSGMTTIAATFNNSGLVEVQSGTLSLNGGGTHSGTFQGSGSLYFGGGTHTLTGSIMNLNVSVGGGAVAMNGTYQAANTALTGGTFTLAAGLTAHSETLNLSGGTLTGEGDIVVSGLFIWASGTMGGAGATTASGGIVFSGNNGRNLDSRTLANEGTAIFQDGFLTAYNGALIHNAAGATWEFQGDDFLYTGTGGATFQNDGALSKSAGDGTMTIFPAFVNGGSVAVQSGTFWFGGGFTQTAAGILYVRIGGLTDFDQYNVGGAASLGGTLDVALTGGYIPDPGDTFKVMTFANHTGQFAAVNGHGQGYTAQYNPMDVTLIAQ